MPRSTWTAGGYRSRIGLISLGAIGKLVAQKLQALELEVLAYEPFMDAPTAAGFGVALASLQELFSTCDVVSLHAPCIPETENMITAPLLRSMKGHATFINTSRGALVNEPDLCEVLKERPDLTAILDVTHPEPPAPDSPFHSLPNLIYTPHIAGSMGGEITRMGRWMVDDFHRFLKAEPLSHEVTSDMLHRMA